MSEWFGDLLSVLADLMQKVAAAESQTKKLLDRVSQETKTGEGQ
jgi:hypothetical protein